jgi:threonine dehydrogenase-like Zn-dependent dehydrogenase
LILARGPDDKDACGAAARAEHCLIAAPEENNGLRIVKSEESGMQGVVFLGGRQLELREFANPQPGPGEVVVRIKASGMCGSDLHHYRGASHVPPDATACIGGHEPAGVVSAVGAEVSPPTATVGERVMVHHYKGCTVCQYCRSGWPQMCTGMEMTLYGTTAHGSHAPFMLVPAASLVPLHDSLSFEVGAAIGCGTGTAWGALKRLGDIGGSTIAVFGQGPVGLSGTMLAAALGARVIAVDIASARLQMAREFGAAEVVNAAEVDPVEAIRDVTHGSGAQLALETSGAPQAASGAVGSLAPWGRACFVGMGATARLDVLEHLRRQLTVMTSWTMSIVDQRACADFIVERGLPVDELFTHKWQLDQAAEAYAEFDRQSAGKGAFVF